MAEHQTSETLDKYRVEINKPTTGGKIGYSVRAIGSDPIKVRQAAIELATNTQTDIDAKLV